MTKFVHRDGELLKLNIDDEILPTQIENISNTLCKKRSVSLFVKREDTCHPIISGNKWHKLRFNLLQAKYLDFKQIISFGGAWSNHIHALAYACQKESFDLVAVIRGEELKDSVLNAMLEEAQCYGAKLHFISRSDYRKKEDNDFLLELQNSFGASYFIPEGGANALGVKGSLDFALHCLEQFLKEHGRYPSHIVLACGSGTMAAGFIRALSEKKSAKKIKSHDLKLVIYAAVQDTSLKLKIENLCLLESDECKNFTSEALASVSWELRDMSGKGFAKLNNEQQAFMESFVLEHQMALDPVYTAKLFHQVLLDIKGGYFPEQSSILAIHSGGLQGARSLLS